MASSSILVLLVVLLSFTIQSLSSAPGFSSKVDSKLISDICSKTKDPKVCLEALTSKPKAASTDLRGLCKLSIDIALDNATATHKFVKTLIDRINNISPTKKGPSVKERLLTCYDDYDKVMDILAVGCNGALLDSDFGLLYLNASLLLDDVNECEDDGGPTPIPQALSARNEIMKDLTSIILTVNNILQHGKN